MEYFFDFSLEPRFIKSNEHYTVLFEYKLEGYRDENFTITPKTNVGKVSLESSYLSPTNKIVFDVIGKQNIELYFEISNILTGERYMTPTKTILNDATRLEAISVLNANMGEPVVEEKSVNWLALGLGCGYICVVFLLVVGVRKYIYAKKMGTFSFGNVSNIFNLGDSGPDN